MSEKIEAQRDIGQIIEGDVHEAPRFNNVVNLNLNEAKKEVQRITEYQRKRINMLVKEWAAICGDEEIEIYKIFITDFGIRFFRELPIEHYMTVKKTLEEWIAAGVAKPSIPPAAPATPAQETIPEPTTAPKALAECVACKEKEASFKRSLRLNFALATLLLASVACCGWLLYQMPAPGEAIAADSHCLYEGKPYSAGSTIKAAGGVLKECIATTDGRSVAWSRVK
ncbi:phage-encoded membrane protein [Herbaspirillum rubrisubalbicans]|uniref:Phage-encoded membrane protein n=1 Tax=Herbaspirillum rubrisubalbicans TaxID=80842 RepID=A0ABX9BUA4_9BURK|nr:hypothetical protein [Herbaspirillum rubrisubalbicans]RAM61270.1 phage-encoded membrane protein [Herbaspirillum rubrisubalbicans]RAN50099.1 phage-encoded membrane protein [Herbaspirillum rubrisubalbicans]